jgi:hypothetical protein
VGKVKRVHELEIGEDGLYLPKTPLRRRMAELLAEGMGKKQICQTLKCGYSYLMEAQKELDVLDHVKRVKLQKAARGDETAVTPKEIRDWGQMAPQAQAFYDHIIKLGFDVEQSRSVVVGYDDEGKPTMEERYNPDYGKIKGLGLKAAEEVVKRVWGNVPQRLDLDQLPGGDVIARMTDPQLELYSRQLRNGTAPSLAAERVMRLTHEQATKALGLDPDWEEADILEESDENAPLDRTEQPGDADLPVLPAPAGEERPGPPEPRAEDEDPLQQMPLGGGDSDPGGAGGAE